MKHCSKLLLNIGLVATLIIGLYPFTDTALSATAPVVSVLPAITAEISTPVRFATDSSGYIYVTDPNSGGILKYNNAFSTVQHIPTSKNGSGVAIAQNGDMLVTQGTYVAVLDKTSFLEKSRFGTFLYANGITVDLSGNIYVTDGRSNNIQKFGVAYNPLVTSIIALSRPSGIQYEKVSNRLVVASSLNGTIKFVNPLDLTIDTTVGTLGVVGTFGYVPNQLVGTAPKFIYPQGISFEYDGGGALYRIYVSDSYQNTVQVLNGPDKTWLANIGDYGFSAGKLYSPSDVLIEQFSATNKRIIVANGGGNISVFGCDNMQPIDVQVASPTLNSLSVTWINPTVGGFSYARVYRSTVSNDANPALVADNQAGTSFNNTGLTPGTTYYYTVRAVSGVTEYANSQSVPGTTRINYNLALNTSGILNTQTNITGAGNISGPPSCSGTSCPTNDVMDNTVVTLTAIPNALTSVFTGWTGYCDPLANNPGVDVNAEKCTFTMTASRNVGAEFTPQSPFWVDGYLLDTLQEAHNTAAGNGSVIEAMAGTWLASSFNLNVMSTQVPYTIYVNGGFDSEFTSASSGTTVIKGRVNLRTGKTIFNNVKIKP